MSQRRGRLAGTMMRLVAMPSAPAATLDALNSLLEAELGSVFRFVGSGLPHLTRASAAVRRPLEEMVAAAGRHADDLARLIEQLGGSPVPPLAVRPDDQYLSFLSLKFLLPKLVADKRLIIRRYENALASLA